MRHYNNMLSFINIIVSILKIFARLPTLTQHCTYTDMVYFLPHFGAPHEKKKIRC